MDPFAIGLTILAIVVVVGLMLLLGRVIGVWRAHIAVGVLVATSNALLLLHYALSDEGGTWQLLTSLLYAGMGIYLIVMGLAIRRKRLSARAADGASA